MTELRSLLQEATRSYNTKVISDQIQWLAKDLTYVSKSTPVVLISHAPMYSARGSSSLSNLSSLLDVLSGYKAYFITGHTHEMYNVDKMSTGNHMELNSGSVCATWWWTGNDTSGLYLARDGSNGGYRVFEVNGTDIKWYYKSTAKDKSVQFRTYDGNKAFVDGTGFPSTLISSISAPWNKQSTDNYVYIEVWDYDPMWKIEVTENGKALATTQMTLKDPLHFLAYEGKGHSTSSFTTQTTPNMFRVQASSATSTLEIKVTDRFGRVYKETMTRPRAFSLAEYNK
ncbi:MAG: calcineurin-like phosphoesterase C-terminal domain-containing protein [Bacteroidales bacterium]|nr:calcineurin-like phosphoesterase C-terminal domain-containing protein [Bacteroidales bacterium]